MSGALSQWRRRAIDFTMAGVMLCGGIAGTLLGVWLFALMRRQGQVVTRSMLLEGVWDLHFDPQTNIIDVHMSRLRAAVDRDFPRPLIHTVRGAGYVLRDDG